MNTKLTLTLEKEVIERARKYAADKGRSLSDIVENYFKHLTEETDNKDSDDMPSRAKQLKGVLSRHKSVDHKKVMEDELIKKYFNE